jgi:hypothetical protein
LAGDKLTATNAVLNRAVARPMSIAKEVLSHSGPTLDEDNKLIESLKLEGEGWCLVGFC